MLNSKPKIGMSAIRNRSTTMTEKTVSALMIGPAVIMTQTKKTATIELTLEMAVSRTMLINPSKTNIDTEKEKLSSIPYFPSSILMSLK